MEEPYEPSEEELASSELEEPYDHLSEDEFTSSFFNILAAAHVLMFYFYQWRLIPDFFMVYIKATRILYLVFTIIAISSYLENTERLKIKIIRVPAPTNMELSEQEPFHQSFFNFLIIGTILLSYLWLVFPLGLFRGLCNFFLVGFFSLTIIMIFIVVDDPIQEASWLLSNKIDKDQRKLGDHIYTWRRGGYTHHGVCIEDGNVIHIARGAGQGYGIETGLEPFISNSSPSHSKDNPKNPCPRCGDQSNLQGVISSCIECFLSGGDLYLFHYFATLAFFFANVIGGTCTLAPSDPLEVVLNRAKDLLRANDFGDYHILRNNCESFAYHCKTDLAFFSGQVVSLAATFVSIFLLIIVDARSAGLVVDEGFATYRTFRYITVVVAEGVATYCAFRYITVSGQRLKAPVERLRLYKLWDSGLIILLALIGSSSLEAFSKFEM